MDIKHTGIGNLIAGILILIVLLICRPTWWLSAIDGVLFGLNIGVVLRKIENQ